MDRKSARRINRRFYGWIYRVGYRAVHIFKRRLKVVGTERISDRPSVFISRHMNGYGPFSVMAWCDIPRLRIWILASFLEKESCYHQYADYTFSQRLGWPKWASAACAWVLCRVVPWFDRSMGALPVYRGSREIIKTLKMSVESLHDGQNILVMPETDILDREEHTGQLYAGFVQLGRLYCKAYGADTLDFYPVYTDKEDNTIYIRPPVTFHAGRPYQQERDRMLEALRVGMSAEDVWQKEYHEE
ncbi:MAG: hypothetical protein PHD32_09880 [Eubacteriales bacterium]|nr:hypothetical protein [Eubacteriales bacterium]